MSSDLHTKLTKLLRDDPMHCYDDEELDAIEELDPALALRIARTQHLLKAQQSEYGDCEKYPYPERAQVESALIDVRKILSQDGGDIELVDIHVRSVRVRMKGACVGCPNSVLDLKNVVERIVKGKVPGVRDVVNVF